MLSTVHNSPAASPAQVKMYQNWKMTTSTLALQLLEVGPSSPANLHRIQLQQCLSQAISEVIRPFMRSSPDNHGQILFTIIDQAIDIDKEISMKAARYTWAFSPAPMELPFDFIPDRGNLMLSRPGEGTAEKLAAEGRARVCLVMVPGLRQRGFDNGDPASFEQEQFMSPMEVTCVEPEWQKEFPPTR